ncbi:MAG: aminopeptidase YwaD [Planctomycetota bacterium]|jgi:aminopeptidase YwaD
MRSTGAPERSSSPQPLQQYRVGEWGLVSTLLLGLGAVGLSVACRTPAIDFEPSAGGGGTAEASGYAQASQSWHVGPDVAIDGTGTARFVDALLEGFSTKRAMETLRFVDGYYRAPGNDGYEAVVDQLIESLELAGFRQGNPDARLRLEVISEPMDMPAWTPLSAQLSVETSDGVSSSLHEFHSAGDTERTLLPINAPSADVTGGVAMSLEELDEGEILVTKANLKQVLKRAKSRGAAGVVSASLYSFNIDPSGADRHLEAIQYRRLKEAPGLPVMQISPRVYRDIEQAVLRDRDVDLRMQATVRWDERPLRTVIATIRGTDRAEESVVVVSHIQEPGACDNASGVAGLLESVVSLVHLLRSGAIETPSRTLSFSWGDEFSQSRTWLRTSTTRAVAAISSDMTGQSRSTGAIALLERTPDPGAVRVLPPDAHTPWGANEVAPEDLQPNGFAIIARNAMIDVGLRDGGGWQTADHPWEGGSDHDIFNENGVPAVLLWHFTDFTYHTSLDRLEFIDSSELRRMQCAILGAALGAADANPTDLGRYLRSLDKEIDLRVSTAESENDPELAQMWKDWGHGARQWLRNLCLGIDEELPEPRRQAEVAPASSDD